MAKWHWGRRRDTGKSTPARSTLDGATPAVSVNPAQQVSGSGNATATNGGIAVTGIYNDHSTVMLPPEAVAPAGSVKARPGLDNLPYRPGRFVSRTAELDRLDAAMAGHQGRPGGVLLQAVHGLGGIGKSALAAHWAANRAGALGLTPIRWITADSPAGIEQGLAALGMALQPAASKVMTVEALVENAKEWLATHTGWLLVLDNVNDPADIAELLARSTAGRFLVTSRLATVWHDATTVIRLDVLDPADSLALLREIVTSGGPRDLAGADELCAELGHLPLAVEQAAAYLAQSPLLTPRSYLDLLKDDPAAMLRRGAVGAIDAERTVARTWRVALDTIAEWQPLAAEVLRIMAWYAPDDIPAGLLDDLAEPAELADALGTLNAYSMIKIDAGSRSLAVHRLVQSVTRTADADDPHRTPDLVQEARLYATASLLSAAQPCQWQDPATWPTGHTLLPHMDAVARHTPLEADTTKTAKLLNHTGVFLDSQGLAARASVHLRRALAHHERALGPDHLDTIACRHNLAGAYQGDGDLRRAIPLFERALEDAERTLGATHPLTLACRNNLADAHRAAGRTDRALDLLEENVALGLLQGTDELSTLAAITNYARAQQAAGNLDEAVRLLEGNIEDCVREFGEDHHLTLVTRHNLTAARLAAGRRLPTAELFEQDLHDMERVLGEDHPDTVLARGDLAYAYKEAGDLDRAVPLLERTLHDMERVHGENHTRTRTIRMALSLAHREAGDLDRARSLAAPRPNEPVGPGSTGDPHAADERHPDARAADTRSADIGYAFLKSDDPEGAMPLLAQAYHDSREGSGEKHRNTLTARHNLAVAHLMSNDPGPAIPLFQQNLRVREQTLGEDHPDTLSTLRHLADSHRLAGHFDRAVHLYDKTFQGRTRALGPAHTDTLAALNLLAYSLRLTGLPKEAIPLYQRALHGMETALGPSHTDVLTARNHLAEAHQDAGDLQRAIPLYEDNLTACARTLGEDHPHTLTARHNLAVAHAATRNYDRALALLESNLPHQERVHGAEHPDSLTTRMNIASTYQVMGMRKEALRLYKQTLDSCIRALGITHPLTLTVHAKRRSARRRRP
ncbi:tetratricopeptide repeat protein [Streptomyces sp. ISL-66]|uniref:tetratricopeptide repeat protein n=1 Tax=Streptomyces sp. ISL-66 TaxID=2819186 RepID=UPI001BEB1E93|nr:tetratricopeptide repeat protein [Streptomyces sp. ISL-66]MBT2468712.1 tetratricopeptide repeat protein [Streptomyces sp. ISL-66]